VNEHEASTALLCSSVRQFLIYSTFVYTCYFSGFFLFCQDVLTDLKADAEILPIEPMNEDWLAHKVAQ